MFCCLEPGCYAHADTQAPGIIGIDDQRNPVWMAKVTCAAGHHYFVEVPVLHAMASFQEVEALERKLGLAGA